MKNGILILLLCLTTLSFGQTVVSEDVKVSSGSEITLEFRDANLVNIRGWDENYIKVEARVLINMGKNDDAYVIEVDNNENTVSGYIKEKKTLPEMIQIRKDGRDYYFDTGDWDSPEIKKFYDEYGKDGIEWMTHGVVWEIELTVNVPRNQNLVVNSRHGIIDIESFNGPLKANSRHGGIDVALSQSANTKFKLITRWGEIYNNLDLKYDKKQFSESGSDWNTVEAYVGNGSGPVLELESRHANIYLRKQ